MTGIIQITCIRRDKKAHVLFTARVEESRRRRVKWQLNKKEMNYYKIVYEWNQTDRDYPHGKTIHELFQEQVKKEPDNIALVFEGQQLTYRQLNERSNQLAHQIRKQYRQKIKQELKPDTLIALYLDKSLEMVVSILAVLKSGGAYVPIDPSYPYERVGYILNDTDAKLILAQRHLVKERHPGSPLENFFYTDLTEEFYTREQSEDLPTSSKATDLAYVIYTSGTTGQPKGVMVEHKSVINLIQNQVDGFGIKSKNRALQFASNVFDASVSEIFTALSSGAQLFILSNKEKQDNQLLINYLEKYEINVATLPPALLNGIGYRDLPDLRTLVVAGETSSKELMEKWGCGRKLINAYGPTETTVCASMHQYSEGDLHTNIGRALPNTRLYILDNNQMPVPIGVTGELYIGGAGLARGYLNRPDLTNQRFVPNPFATEADKGKGYTTLYKTGDLVRWLPDGDMEYLGRNDEQVKIRGYRIELGEIENALSQIEGIRQSCVLAKERTTEAGTIKFLVGYYVPDNNHAFLHQAAIFERLSQVLPEYMVPNGLVVMESFPLTVNGKLDKRTLPEPDFSNGNTYNEPVTELEIKLCGVCSEILGLPTNQIGTHQSFFKLGGNSLLSTRLLARVREEYNIEIPLKLFLANPSVKSLAAALKDGHRNYSKTIFPAVTRIKRTEDNIYELTFPQRAIWVLNEVIPVSLAYNTQFSLSLEGALDIAILQKSINEIIKRHESLRTTFHSVESNPVQKIHKECNFVVNVINIANILEQEKEKRLTQIRVASCQHVFDIKSLPLFKWDLVILGSNRYELIIVEHHFVHDGWSVPVLLNELSSVYKALSKDGKSALGELDVQMVDFAAWQRVFLQSNYAAEGFAYWKSKLKDFSYLKLYSDASESGKPYVGETIDTEISIEDFTCISDFAQQAQTSLFVIMLSAFKVFLYKYTGETDITIGSSTANRRMKEFEALIGMCVNTQVLRTQISRELCFKDVIELVKNTVYESQHYQDIPFELLVKELSPDREYSRNPFFGISFNFHDSRMPPIDLPGVKGKVNYLSNNSSKFDILVIVIPPSDHNAAPILRFEYSTNSFKRGTADKFISGYLRLLKEAITKPQKPISALSIVTDLEWETLINVWNATEKEFPKGKTVHQLFQEQAERTPNVIALVYEGHQLTYRELNERSNQLARHIRKQYREKTKKKLQADTFIALYLDRSIEMVVSIMAVLKSGGAYVPIDPAYPDERIKYIIEDTHAEIILTQQHLITKERSNLPGEKLLYTDLTEELYIQEQRDNLAAAGKATDLAYVIYTSGTTGKPKAVMVEHRHVSSFTTDNNFIDYEKVGTVAGISNYAFDGSVFDVFFSLINGKTLVVIDKVTLLDLSLLDEKLIEFNADTIFITTSLFNALVQNQSRSLNKLRQVLFGGEPCNVQIVNQFKEQYKTTSLIHVYGPTENIVFASYCRLNDYNTEDTVPIGRRLSDKRLYVLDDNLAPVPIGVIGELYVGGAGVARGYLNFPALTAERFIPNPFATEADKASGDARLYKTGDLVRWLSDGNVAYIGRNDDQVKIRGYRIELGEIENALSQIEGIKQSCVLAREKKTETGSNRYLAGYYVLEPGTKDITKDKIIDKLSLLLPEYMVPHALVEMEAFPLTPNAKLDKRALPDPEFDASEAYLAPANDTEAMVCNIWQELLGIQKVGIINDFFKAGGSSILAIQASHRMSEALGFGIKVADIFKHKTIRSLLSNRIPKEDAENEMWEIRPRS